MLRYRYYLSVAMTVSALCGLFISSAYAGERASLVIRFGSGKASLGADDKASLRQFIQQYDIGPQSRVFIVGFTDAKGDQRQNDQLSRKRAQAIRRELIRTFGLEASVVMALGKGEANPVANNRRPSGRALNRRAEIYLVNCNPRKPARVYGPDDPNLPEIASLVGEAQHMIRQRRLAEATQVLNQARGLGGDHYSDWQTAWALAGFYANAPVEEVGAHLDQALRIDPYNATAREYQSRITARRKVASGQVTKEMGLTPQTAIRVSALAEQYEYLRLFKVEPRSHRKLKGRTVEAWACTDGQDAAVVYYFDHADIYDWAFERRSAEGPGQRARAEVAHVSLPPAQGALGTTAKPAVKAGANDPVKIWESGIFK